MIKIPPSDNQDRGDHLQPGGAAPGAAPPLQQDSHGGRRRVRQAEQVNKCHEELIKSIYNWIKLIIELNSLLN